MWYIQSLPHDLDFFLWAQFFTEEPGYLLTFYSLFTAPQSHQSSLNLINCAWGWPESWPLGLCVCVSVCTCVCVLTCMFKRKKIIKRALLCSSSFLLHMENNAHMGTRLPVASDLAWVEGLGDLWAGVTELFFRQTLPNFPIQNQLCVLKSLSTNSVNKTTWNILTRFKIEQSTERVGM